MKVNSRIGRGGGRDGIECLKDEITSKCTDHHNIAVRKIDHSQDAINQSVANGYQCIYTSKNKASQGKACPGIRSVDGIAIKIHHKAARVKYPENSNPNNPLDDFIRSNFAGRLVLFWAWPLSSIME